MDKAEEIREDMRERVREQHERTAQATVARAIEAIRNAVAPVAYVTNLQRNEVAPIVAELDALVTLLEEAVPSLPVGEAESAERAA